MKDILVDIDYNSLYKLVFILEGNFYNQKGNNKNIGIAPKKYVPC